MIINHHNHITEKEQKRYSLNPYEIKRKILKQKRDFRKLPRRQMVKLIVVTKDEKSISEPL